MTTRHLYLNILSLKKESRYLVTVLFLALVSTAWFFWIYQPLKTLLTSYTTYTTKLRIDIAHRQAIISDQSNLNRLIRQSSLERRKKTMRFTSKKLIPSLLAHIVTHAVTARNIQMVPAKQDTWFTTQAASVEIVGSIDTLSTYVAKLKEHEHIHLGLTCTIQRQEEDTFILRGICSSKFFSL